MILFQRAIPCPSGISLWWDAFRAFGDIDARHSSIHLATGITPRSNLQSTRYSSKGIETGSTVEECCGRGGWWARVANREAVSTAELYDRVADGPPNKHKHEPRSMPDAAQPGIHKL